MQIMRLSFLVLFIIMFSFSALAQRKESDSLLLRLSKAKSDSAKAALCFKIARNFGSSKIIDSAQKYSTLGLKYSRNVDSVWGRIEYSDLLGVIYRNRSKYKDALNFHFLALNLAEKMNFISNIPSILNNIGVVYRRLDEHQKAIEYHLRALQLADSLNDETNIPISLNGLGNSYSSLGNYVDALKYYNQALELQTKRHNVLGVAINQNNIGEVYEKTGKLELALTFYQNSLDNNFQLNNKRGIAIAYSCIGNVYKKLEQFKTALNFYVKAISLDKQLNDGYYISGNYNNIGEIYSKLANYSKALTYLDSGFLMAKKIGSKNQVQMSCYNKSIVYKQLNRYQDALEFYELSTIYKDSIINETNTKNSNNLQLLYEAERNANQIKLLEKDRENHSVSLFFNRIVFAVALFVCVVVLVSIFIYRQNVIRKKNSKELEEKNKEIERVNISLLDEISEKKHAEELLKTLLNEKDILFAEIHHRVKNNLAIISGLLQLQAFNTNDEHAQAILFDSQNRIQSMALIHEKIYQSEVNAQIEFSSYIKDLCGSVRNNYKTPNVEVTIDINVKPVFVELNVAVPCGMLLNELISNAFKHAFAERNTGTIVIEFEKRDNEFILSVSDNGVGINLDYASKTLGMMLIETFVKQLNGKMSIKNENGTVFIINFMPSKMKVWK